MGLHSKVHQETAHLVYEKSDLRSDGPLSEHALNEARDARARLIYDPAQNGWISSAAIDDIDLHFSRPGWPKAKENEAVSFRPWAETDAPIFRNLLNNPNVWTFLPTGYPGDISLDAAKDLIALAGDDALHKVRAICVNGLPVGQVRLEYHDHAPELSYWLGEPYWRKGIGGRAVSRFVTDCFASDQNLDQIMARVKDGNVGSLKILEAAGFLRDAQPDQTAEWIILRCNQKI